MNRSDVDDDVLRALTDRGPRHVADLAAELDEHPLSIDVSCTRLHRSGRVRLIGAGRYTLVED